MRVGERWLRRAPASTRRWAIAVAIATEDSQPSTAPKVAAYILLAVASLGMIVAVAALFGGHELVTFVQAGFGSPDRLGAIAAATVILSQILRHRVHWQDRRAENGLPPAGVSRHPRMSPAAASPAATPW